jgi:hypothetical protein
LRTEDPPSKASYKYVVPNMKYTCSQIVIKGYLLVSCKLVRYVKITIKSFYLLKSFNIQPKL